MLPEESKMGKDYVEEDKHVEEPDKKADVGEAGKKTSVAEAKMNKGTMEQLDEDDKSKNLSNARKLAFNMYPVRIKADIKSKALLNILKKKGLAVPSENSTSQDQKIVRLQKTNY